MADTRRVYSGEHVDVSYYARRCRHAAECLRGLPTVFDTGRKPWILPDGDEATRVVDVVARCPTGALRTHPHDVSGEPVPDAALCSCGASQNAPYCSGSGTCSSWPPHA
jgi:uncharacterized Fe-S cluster protein YjdI